MIYRDTELTLHAMAFTGRFIVNLAHFAAQQGVDMQLLLPLVGKPEEELCREDCFVEDNAYNAVIEKAVELTGDHCFGLHAGEHLNLAAAGLIAQITHTCATVRQALEYCCTFANLGCSALPMAMVDEGEVVKIILTPDPLWGSSSAVALRHTAEGVLVFTVREFHSLTRAAHAPLKIHLPWGDEQLRKEHERVWGCPVAYGQKEIALFLAKAHVEDKVVTADYNLLRVLVAHAEEKSAQLAQQQDYTALVKRSVVKLIKPEFPTMEQVAAHLNISPRTLQRRLKDEGVTFSALLDSLRKEFALKYLKNPELSIADIAYLLSYADTSAFSRSFKRWTGQSPASYR